MMKTISLLLLTLICCATLCVYCTNRKIKTVRETQNHDCVPNDIKAREIAEEVWLKAFGKRIYEEKPYNAVLKDSSTWVVKGTKNTKGKGGVAYIEIRKSDCEILKLSHGK